MGKEVGNTVFFDLQDGCGCPPDYVAIGDGICQKIETVTPTPPSQPIPVANISPNGLYMSYGGAIIYEDISLKQWPIISSPQGGLNWTLAANTIIPSSGISNPYLPGGAPYTSLNPGTDGINYTGGIGINGEHARVIIPAPVGWPGIPLTGPTGAPSLPGSVPFNTSPVVALRESTITSGVLNYGIGAGVYPQFQLVNAPWYGGPSGNWLNERGIKPGDVAPFNCSNCEKPATVNNTCYKCSQWYGFTHCVTINATKTYYIAAAANNAFRIYMNGTLVLEYNLADGMEPTLSIVNIFPITLPAGTHIFQVDMLNYSSDGGMGFEIYDCNLSDLQAVTSSAELDVYKIFSAKERVGGTFDVSSYELQGYICPEGYVYSACNGAPTCVKVLTADALPFAYKLTPCCGDNPATYVVPFTEGFPEGVIVEGTTVCIKDIDPAIGCWLIERVCEPVNYEDSFTVEGIYVDCFECYNQCKSCTNFFFKLTDCCTDTPLLDEDGDLQVYNYVGVANGTLTPESIAGQIIQQVLNPARAIAIEGCYNLVEIYQDDIPQASKTFLWQDVFDEATTVPTCADCRDCRVCYALTNCQDSEERMITITDLSQYIGHVITIEGCKDKCWTVSLADNCDNCVGPVEIINDYPPTVGSANICKYNFEPLARTESWATGTVVVDGVVYNLDLSQYFYKPFNDLGLGILSFDQGTEPDGIIIITGDHEYGELCVTTVGNDTICLQPVCSNYSKQCTYANIDFLKCDPDDGIVTITIDGQEYSSPPGLINIENIYAIESWLQSLGFDQASVYENELADSFNILFTGNGLHTYGQLVITCVNDNMFINPTCVTIEPSGPDNCELCLPQPEPVVPAPLLNTRAVYPGYKTPGCSPEYTEKVNCAFGQVMNKQMLAVRYGLQTCCDETETDWQIKKELLDFEAIKDTDLTPYGE